MKTIPFTRYIGLVKLIGQPQYVPSNDRSAQRLSRLTRLVLGYSLPKITESALDDWKAVAEHNGFKIITSRKAL